MSDTAQVIPLRNVGGHLRVVAGTDKDGPGLPVWDDKEQGVDRCLMGAKGIGIKTVIVCGIFEDGDLYVASNNETAEFALGLLERAKALVVNSAGPCCEPSDECEDDGA